MGGLFYAQHKVGGQLSTSEVRRLLNAQMLTMRTSDGQKSWPSKSASGDGQESWPSKIAGGIGQQEPTTL
jgi:hypothetical protein